MIREFYKAQEGKAFDYQYQLTDAGGPLLSGGGPSAYNAYNGFNTDPNGVARSPLSQRNAMAHMQTYGGEYGIDWLMDAIDFTTTAAASAEWHFTQDGKDLTIDKDADDPSDAVMAPQPLIDLFNEPNPYMAWEDLCEVTLIDFLLVGNAYWVKWQMNASGQPLALYRMAPQYVKIQPGQFGPDKFLYRLPGENKDTVFTPDKVVHFKRPNPADPYYGMGIVQGGARAMDMELELTKTAANYYKRGALPSGVVQTDRRVPRDVFNKLKMQLRSFYGGSDNAGQLMVLEAGLKYQTLSPSATEALFTEMGRWSRDRVLAMFKLNKSLLGMWDVGDNPQLEQWQTLFDQKTMIPLTKKFARVISRDVTRPGWNMDFVIDYAEAQQPDAVLNRAGTLAKLPGVKVKEVRAAANLAPSTGYPEVDEMILNKPGPELDANGQGGVADPNLPGEAGRPPLPENTQQYQRRTGTPKAPPAHAGGGKTSGKALLDGLVNDLDTQLALIEAKALAPADHVHIGKLGGDVKPPAEDTLFGQRTAAQDVTIADTARQINNAATQLERGLLDAADGKAGNTVYQRVKNSPAWKAFSSKLESILSDAAEATMSQANMHHTNAGFDPAELDYEEEVKSVVHRPNGGVNSVMKTLKKRVLDAVLAGQRKGDPAKDISGALQGEISDWTQNTSSQIATDTITVAYNSSTLAVAEANNAKEVIVSDGTDHDEPCIEANGQKWSIEDARDNMQEHSRCRRAFALVGS